MSIDHDLRRSGVSGSDIAAIFGCDEWRDQYAVWLEKHGLISPAEASPRMKLGKYLEQGIAQYYADLKGYEILWCDQTMRHQKREWMIYTPDALVKGQKRGVDAKIAFWDQRHKWGPTENDIPERVQLQAWWYMAALDYDYWDVAVLIGEEVPRIYTVERDPVAERAMLARAEEWYIRFIAGREEPPVGGSDFSTNWLKRHYSHHRPDLRDATEEEIGWLEAYASVRDLIKPLEKRKDELENQLRRAVADKEGIEWSNGKFTWKRSKDSMVVDWQALACELLTHHGSDEEVKRLLAKYTSTKPGHRTIRFTCDTVVETAA